MNTTIPATMENWTPKTIAIIGASGNLGRRIVSSLLNESSLALTLISRSESPNESSPDPRVVWKKGDYTSSSFFEDALAGQDVLVNALGLSANPETTTLLYLAAKAKGVRWIIPQGFGCDFQNPNMVTRVPILAGVAGLRADLVKLGISYTGFINNPWLEYNLQSGFFGIDVQARKFSIYGQGNVKFNVSTLQQVALAVARLLQLSSDPTSDVTLDNYKNQEIYISSFSVSQLDLFNSVLRVTGTAEKDWTVDRSKDAEAHIADGKKLVEEGTFTGFFNVLFGNLFTEGVGGNYETSKGVENGKLRLEPEDLDDAVRRGINEAVALGK